VGSVSLGLAPGTAAATLALPLLRTVRARHPGILLYLNETYGSTLSELVMNGRMDLAVLYGGQAAVHGLSFQPLLKERLCLVGPGCLPQPIGPVQVPSLGEMNLYLPRPYNVVRRMVDEALARFGLTARVVAEIESPSTLTAVIADGLGATILPASMARDLVAQCDAWQAGIVAPVLEAPLALCQSANLPLSEPAQAVKEIICELVADWPGHLLAQASEPMRSAA
jgi:LysR family nitrogen assimilation transcriptional regulator